MIEIEKEFLKKLIDDRHFLHMNPELSGEEFATTEFIKKKLKEHNNFFDWSSNFIEGK